MVKDIERAFLVNAKENEANADADADANVPRIAAFEFDNRENV